MGALGAWLISAAVLGVPVLYLYMQVMALQRMQGVLRKLAVGVGLLMAGLFVFVVWGVVFAGGTMAPMLLVVAAPVGLIALSILWALHWVALGGQVQED